MLKRDAGDPAKPTIDRSSFTEAQWDALSDYVAVRKRQRTMYRIALPSLAALVLSWLLANVSQGRPLVPGWLVAVASVVGLGAAGLSHVTLRRNRARLRASGMSAEWIEGSDRYPSGKI